MHKRLYSIAIHAPEVPRAVYFIMRGGTRASKPRPENVTARVAKLYLEATGRDERGPHLLRRVDEEGKTVWQTHHPSLLETFWHAEWEYGVKQEEWQAERQNAM